MANTGVVDPFGGFKQGLQTFIQERQFQQSAALEKDKLGVQKEELGLRREKAAKDSKAAGIREERAIAVEEREQKKAARDTTSFEKAQVAEIFGQAKELWETGTPENKQIARGLLSNPDNQALVKKHRPGAVAVLEASDDDLDQLTEGNALIAESRTLKGAARTSKMKEAVAALGQAGEAGQFAITELQKEIAKGNFNKQAEKAAKQALDNSKRLTQISEMATRLKAARGLSDFALAMGLKGDANQDAVNTALKQAAKEAKELGDTDLATSLLAMREGAQATSGGFKWDPVTGKVVPKGL